MMAPGGISEIAQLTATGQGTTQNIEDSKAFNKALSGFNTDK